MATGMELRKAQKLARQMHRDDPMTVAEVFAFRTYDPSDGSGINDVIIYRVEGRDLRSCCRFEIWEPRDWAERLELVRAYDARTAG